MASVMVMTEVDGRLCTPRMPSVTLWASFVHDSSSHDPRIWQARSASTASGLLGDRRANVVRPWAASLSSPGLDHLRCLRLHTFPDAERYASDAWNCIYR